MDLMNSAAGFLVGLIVGLTGVGGGALMTPILVLLFGFSPATAIGTDLWFAAITKVCAIGVHHRTNNVDWRIFRLLSIGSLPTACFTSFYLWSSGRGKLQDTLLLSTLSGVLMLTALAMLFKEPLHAYGRSLRIGSPDFFKRLQPFLTVGAGVLLGLLVTLTSIGAGALGATLLLYLYPLRLTAARLVGTDIAHAIPLAIVAGSGHLLAGNVDWQLLCNLLLGSVPGVLLGARLGGYAPDALLRTVVAVVLFIVGVQMAGQV